MQRPILKTQAAEQTSSEPPARNLGSPLQLIAITICIFIVSQIIFGEVIVMLWHLIFNPNSHLDIDKDIAAQFIFIAAAEGSAAWLAIKAVQRRRLSIGVIGLGRRPVFRDFWMALIG